MAYYEFTLTAKVTRKIVQAAETYEEALRLALARFDLTTAQADPEVEIFHVLDDDEVLQAMQTPQTEQTRQTE